MKYIPLLLMTTLLGSVQVTGRAPVAEDTLASIQDERGVDPYVTKGKLKRPPTKNNKDTDQLMKRSDQKYHESLKGSLSAHDKKHHVDAHEPLMLIEDEPVQMDPAEEEDEFFDAASTLPQSTISEEVDEDEFHDASDQLPPEEVAINGGSATNKHPEQACSLSAIRAVRNYVSDKFAALGAAVNKELVKKEADNFIRFLGRRACIAGGGQGYYFDPLWDGFKANFTEAPQKQLSDRRSAPEEAHGGESAACSLGAMRNVMGFVSKKLQESRGYVKAHMPADAQALKDLTKTAAKGILFRFGKSACQIASLPPAASAAFFEGAWNSMGVGNLVNAGVDAAGDGAATVNGNGKACSLGAMKKVMGFVTDKMMEAGSQVKGKLEDPKTRKDFIVSAAKAMIRIGGHKLCAPMVPFDVYLLAWNNLMIDQVLEGYVLKPAYDAAAYIGPVLSKFAAHDYSGQLDEEEDEE
jgi:hypothetical protein